MIFLWNITLLAAMSIVTASRHGYPHPVILHKHQFWSLLYIPTWVCKAAMFIVTVSSILCMAIHNINHYHPPSRHGCPHPRTNTSLSQLQFSQWETSVIRASLINHNGLDARRVCGFGNLSVMLGWAGLKFLPQIDNFLNIFVVILRVFSRRE